MESLNTIIFEDEDFRLEQVLECPIPGYMILYTKANGGDAVQRLPEKVLARLGTMLKQVYAALDTVIKPERIYCGSFGEVLPQVHWHVFPRTLWLQTAFLKAHSHESSPVNGPLLFEWARQFYVNNPVPDSRDLSEIIQRLRDCF